MIRKKWMIDTDYKNVSCVLLQDHLASLRVKLGMSQEEIAGVIGISRQTYYALELKNRSMSWTIYLALVFFFNSCAETCDMLKELRLFPIDLVMKFNDQI